jgi:hypothetical protein
MMGLFHRHEVSEQARTVGEANPSREDTPKWFAYIAVAITLVSMLVGLALMAGTIYWIFRHF